MDTPQSWVDAGGLGEPGSVTTVTDGRRRVAVFRLADGSVRAIDDRCPHEGFPLAQGAVAGEVLTCCHHNFKFDLRDGACLLGDERARVYPVRVEGGRVFVDLAEGDRAEEVHRRWVSLEVAVNGHRIGQIARETVRLLDLGVAPGAIARFAAAWDADHGESGCTHALAVAEEALALAPRLPGLEAARGLVLALELAAEDSARRPAHPVRAPEPPAGDLVAWLRAPIEAEDAPTADARIRGAVRAGVGRDELEPALLRIAADHLFDYGHGLIFTVKALELLDEDWAQAEPILAGLVRGFVLGNRDDMVPAWGPWRRQLAEIVPELPGFVAGTGVPDDREAEVDALVGATARESVDWLAASLQRGLAPEALLDVLSLGAAERLLRFDVAVDLDPGVQDAWLDVTHTLTLVDAVRRAWARHRHPDLLRLWFQAARLVARCKTLDGDRVWPSPAAEATPEALLAAIRAGDERVAVGIAAGIDPSAARWPLQEHALGDPMARPIFVAHALKLATAGAAEAEATRDPRPLCAAVRFLAAPRRERRTAQRVSEAIVLVRDGRPPRVLAH